LPFKCDLQRYAEEDVDEEDEEMVEVEDDGEPLDVGGALQVESS
jgi:hypothetical protein